MKTYTSCFVGISLPDIYQQEFEDLLSDLSTIVPQLEIVHPATPHITVYYLDDQSQFNLPAIAESVKSKIDILTGTEISVSGFGYFRGDDPRVLFLDVKYPKDFRDFNQALEQKLTKYFAEDNKLPFQPHMTVARLYAPEAQQAYKKSADQIKSRLNAVKWTFLIKEVVLYGVDSTKHPQFQEKLITIKLT